MKMVCVQGAVYSDAWAREVMSLVWPDDDDLGHLGFGFRDSLGASAAFLRTIVGDVHTLAFWDLLPFREHCNPS